MDDYCYIKTEEKTGRGVYASTKLFQGTIIAFEELLVLSPEDTVKVNQTSLNQYTFKYNDIQDCLVLGNGELYNHDFNPNVEFKLIEDFDLKRKLMMFKALKDIEVNEQLFIDYCSDVTVNLDEYKTNLIG